MIIPVGAGPVMEDLNKGPALSLRKAIVMGIEKNLDIRIEKLNILINREDVIVNDAEFDPLLDASISSQKAETPSALMFFDDDIDMFRSTGADVGIGKKFQVGLSSRLSFETNRFSNNSSIDALRPQYRDYLILDLTQPLLRDFGVKVNTANLRISQNMVRYATYGYLDRAQQIGEEIENTYYDLAKSLKILSYRIESRNLADELLKANRIKFGSGVIPISEVQESETAVAARDEDVIYAGQQVETISNRLKDLLEIRFGDKLYKGVFVTKPVPGIEQPFPSLEKALAIALKERPDLEKNRLEIINQGVQVEYFANQKLPRIDLVSTLGVNGLSGGKRQVSFNEASYTSPYEGNYGDSFSGMFDGDGYEWIVGLKFTYPFGNRSARAMHRRAGQEKRQAVYRLKRLEGRAETEVTNALVIVERSLERVKVAERFERLAETTLNQEMERLKEGLSDTFHILIFQNTLIRARIRKVTALVDFNKGLANLYRSMGSNLKRFHILARIDTEKRGYNE